jgi:hypothetical protein
MPRIRRWFSWKVWDEQSSAVALEKQERERQAEQAQRGQAATYHAWNLGMIAQFLRESPWINPQTPHNEAWDWYLRWCARPGWGHPPVSEREFAQERNLYR